MSWKTILHKLWVGFKLRCPHCEKGRTFQGLFKANRTCEACGYHFEIEDGESVGGMYINLGIASMTSIGGFFLAFHAFEIPFEAHLLFWVTYTLLFVILFYRNSRSIWMAITYLAGGKERQNAGVRTL